MERGRREKRAVRPFPFRRLSDPSTFAENKMRHCLTEALSIRLAFAVGLAVLLLGFLACTKSVQLDQSTTNNVSALCKSDSECAGNGIGCIYGVCRTFCTADEDCGDKGLCFTDPFGRRGCRVASEQDCTTNTCPSPLVCAQDGTCKACSNSQQTGCGTKCFDLTSDPEHCGECTKTAVADPTDQNSLGVCIAGSPKITCKTGFDSRCGTPLRCTNTQTDRNNCGACGVVCSNSNGTTSCEAGACKPVCDIAHADCNGNPNDGCEADVSSNTTCGSGPGGTCAKCAAPITCVSSANGFYGCATCELRGLTTCAAGTGTSKCVDLQTDATNCGSCGTVCPGGVCKAGHCDSCRVEVPPGLNWQCARNTSCQDLFCPNMIDVPGHPLTAHLSGVVLGDSSTRMQLSALYADGQPNSSETHYCGNDLTNSPIDCLLPSSGAGQSPAMTIPADAKVRVRLYGACGNPGTCRVQPGSVLSIYHQ